MSKTTASKPKTSYPHLLPQVQNAFTLPNEERTLLAFKDKWIEYTAATAILEEMKDLVSLPQRDRPPNILVVSPADNGKSALANHFARAYPPVEKGTSGSDEIPVVKIDAPGEGVERRIYSQILNALQEKYPKSSRPEELFHQVAVAFETLKVKMLIIDEIHGILKGRADRVAICLHTLKLLGNETRVPIVGLGIERAEDKMSGDEEISSRFTTVHLPKWQFNEEYMRLLASYSQILPLKKASNLTDPSISRAILVKAKHLLGGIDRILAKATRIAIQTGVEQITEEVIDQVRA